MYIDIHSHMTMFKSCHEPDVNTFPPQAEDMIRYYDAVGVEKALVLPLNSPEVGFRQNCNDEIMAICRMYPERFFPFYNMDPRSLLNTPQAEFEKVLKSYKDQGCRGVGEVTANLDMDDERVQNLFRAVEASDLVLTFHLTTQIGNTYGLVDEVGMPKLEKALQKFPKLKFFGHSQPFWAEMTPNPTLEDRNGYPEGRIFEEGAVPKLLRKYENLYGDLSAGSGCNALTRDEEYAVKFLNEFQDKLLFGIDGWSKDGEKPDLMIFLDKLKNENKISSKIYDKVTWKNAVRLLEL